MREIKENRNFIMEMHNHKSELVTYVSWMLSTYDQLNKRLFYVITSHMGDEKTYFKKVGDQIYISSKSNKIKSTNLFCFSLEDLARIYDGMYFYVKYGRMFNE